MRPARRCCIAFTIAVLGLAVTPRAALAHPMGNFSINHYTKIVIGRRAIELDYIIDMAEIPTFQEVQGTGIAPRVGDPSLTPYLARQCERLKDGLMLVIEGHDLALKTVWRQAIFPAGAGGLPTMKMGFVYQASLPHTIGASPLSLHYRDSNFPDRAGWKEIIALARPGAALVKSSIPAQDRSSELSNYPTDLLHSPPQLIEADLAFRAAPPGIFTTPECVRRASSTGWLTMGSDEAVAGVRLKANRQGTPRNTFTELIKSNRVDLAFVLTAAFIAAVLGGLHALEPGHGKTLVAAYLVGSHGKARHAVLLGAVVTASHTISVYALGIFTLYASQWILPERLYPWLGIVSGLLVAGLGFTLFIRRYLSTDPRAHGGYEKDRTDHYHHRDDQDRHHDHALVPIHRHTWWGSHVHENDAHSHGNLSTREYPHGAANEHIHQRTYEQAEIPAPDGLTLKSLFALGITGGIVPCPAALVVLLSSLAFHRVAFGLFLIVAFSAGLAAVLISFGLAMVYAGRSMSRLSRRGALTERWLPLASSAVITVVGVTITLQSLLTAGLLRVGT